MAEYNQAARLREVMRTIAEEVVARERTRKRYAYVESINLDNNRATVKFPGDDTSITVPMGGVIPRAGATVQLGGPDGSYYVDRVVSGVDLAATADDDVLILCRRWPSSRAVVSASARSFTHVA